MKNKNKLCEAEVRKNLVLVELGKPLTLPLAILNESCEFKKEWDRIQDKWHPNEVKCLGCSKLILFGREKYCSEECMKAKQKAYEQTPEFKVKRKAYQQTPEYKAYQKAYQQTPKFKVKRKAQKKAYYQKNKEKILAKIRKRNLQ